VATSKNINKKKFIKLNPFNLNTFLDYCFINQIQSIIVEGGKKTLQNFIDNNFWDESRIFTAQIKLNDGVTSPELNSKSQMVKNFDGDELKFYFN
jgi:diaminohydroxyphosphoribosylaminopyrimidine deaminase/5-amino-6-(5-phosphoribosylamino)uracil reductase